MELIKIVINSVEDAKAGKPIVEGSTVEKLFKSPKPLTVGILEKGMSSGRTSLMFCTEDKDGNIHIAEMSARHFEALAAAVRGATERFGDNKINE